MDNFDTVKSIFELENNFFGIRTRVLAYFMNLSSGFWWENLRERHHLGDPGEDGRIILRWVFRKWDVVAWTGSIWLRIGTGVGLL